MMDDRQIVEPPEEQFAKKGQPYKNEENSKPVGLIKKYATKDVIIESWHKLLECWLKPSFHAWLVAVALIFIGKLTPTFLEFCGGTGALIASTGLRKLFINKI